MKNLLSKLAEKNRKKLLEEDTIMSRNIITALACDYVAIDLSVLVATELFWVIFPNKPFNLSVFYELFKINNNEKTQL